MSGWLFLAISAVITAGVFLNGLRFATMKSNPLAGWKLFGQDIQGSKLSPAQLNRIGYLQMIIAPLFLIFFIALTFGLFGPVSGITPIKF